MKKEAARYQNMRMESDTKSGTEPGIGRISLGKQTFSSLGNPVYRLFFFGMLGFTAPMNMEMLARSLLIYRITGSASILGLMALVTAIPMLFRSLSGWRIADGFETTAPFLHLQHGSALVSLGIAL